MSAISEALRGPQENTKSRARILVVEDDAAMLELLREALDEEDYEVETAAGGRAGVERVKRGGIDLVVSDVKMPDLDGLDMLREIKACEPSPYVITITAFGSIDTAIRAVKLGAFDYITKPFEIDQLLVAVEKALGERALRSQVARLQEEVERAYRFDNIIGRSPAMQEIFGMVRRLAGSSTSVLVTGDSGTGKELIARSLHFTSPRKHRPFVPLNCAAIPDALMESELFGYKRGAFTDARSDRAGIFVEADGGTIFLDEIAELSPALQAKLLRVLQDREVRPLGASGSEKVNVRVIAATNRDLDRASQGRYFSRGSLLPTQRHPHPSAAAAGTSRRHPAAVRSFPDGGGGAHGQADGKFPGEREESAARLQLAGKCARAGECGGACGGAGRRDDYSCRGPSGGGART